MATPSLIFRVYRLLRDHAAEVRDFQEAKGEKVSGTVSLLCAGDAVKPLTRWGEEMAELCGVLDGTHDDSYLMEATQTFYWASLYSSVRGASWSELDFEAGRRQAVTAFSTVAEIRSAAERIVAMGAAARPNKLFLVWNAADQWYRHNRSTADVWSLEQIMEADFQDMLKRDYLKPVIALAQAAEAADSAGKAITAS